MMILKHTVEALRSQDDNALLFFQIRGLMPELWIIQIIQNFQIFCLLLHVRSARLRDKAWHEYNVLDIGMNSMLGPGILIIRPLLNYFSLVRWYEFDIQLLTDQLQEQHFVWQQIWHFGF